MFQWGVFLGLGVLILICIYTGLIVIIISLVYKLMQFIIDLRGSREKTDYMNLGWLKHQYFDLGKTLQEIALDQNSSIIKIKRWVDKLENASNDLGDKGKSV
ncbi:MAG: hypothetical protein ACFE8L_04160 [Candidatus Hodarchaeota archaeon]